MSAHGWIAVDFDGTLAEYTTWQGASHVGAPIAPMVERVKAWLAEGRTVKIFTARAYCPEIPLSRGSPDYKDVMRRRGETVSAVRAIRAWCREHLGQVLEVTCVKDYGMVELYDDRAVGVEMNTGRLLNASTRGLS